MRERERTPTAPERLTRREPRFVWPEVVPAVMMALLGMVIGLGVSAQGGWVMEGGGWSASLLALGILVVADGVLRVLRLSSGPQWGVWPLGLLALAMGAWEWMPGRDPASRAEWVVACQAMLVGGLAAQYARDRAGRVWWLGLILGVGSLTVFFALMQYSWAPAWSPSGKAPAPGVSGFLAGVLGRPEVAAAVLVVLFPLAAVAAFARRFPGPARLLCGTLALVFSLAVLLTGSVAGMVALLLQWLALPLVVARSRHRRLRVWRRILVGGVLAAALAWAGGTRIWETAVLSTGKAGAPSAAQVAADSFHRVLAETPWMGWGGARSAWDRRDATALDRDLGPLAAPGGWRQLVLSRGWVGLGLWAIAPLGLSWAVFRVWRREAWERLRDPDGGGRWKGSVRGPMPLSKLLAGANLLVLAGWVVAAWEANFLHFGAPLLILGASLALVPIWGTREISPARTLSTAGYACATALLGAGLIAGAWPLAAGMTSWRQSMDLADHLFSDPRLVRHDPGLLEVARVRAVAATRLLPDHPDLRADLAAFALWQFHYDPWELDDWLAQGREQARIALALDPASPRARWAHGLTLALAGTNAQALQAFRSAAEVAPGDLRIRHALEEAEEELARFGENGPGFLPVRPFPPDPLRGSGPAPHPPRSDKSKPSN